MSIKHEGFGTVLRLGNFLFQYAWSTKYCFLYGCQRSLPSNYYLWDYLVNPPQLHDTEPEYDLIVRPTKWEYDKEEQEHLDRHMYDFRNKNTAIALNYFFQSYKAFEGFEQQVYDSLRINEDYKEFVLHKYGHFFTRPAILISVRLGDFVSHGDFYQIPYLWYIMALEKEFPDWRNMNVIVTSDDIEHAKVIFKDYPFMYAEPNGTHTHEDNFKHYHSSKAIEHFVLGTLVGNYIIGQSTFSWWQAWLGSFNGGKVVHSGKVFSETGNMKDCNTENYYLPTWTKV